MAYFSNKVFEEIKIGDSASLVQKLTQKDIELFALASGDLNPIHLDAEYAKKSFFKQVIGHGMWTAALISKLLGTKLPGPGTIYLSQSLKFQKPVFVKDKITVKVTVIKKYVRKPVLILMCKCTNQHEKIVLTGFAKVLAPTVKMRCKVPTVMLM